MRAEQLQPLLWHYGLTSCKPVCADHEGPGQDAQPGRRRGAPDVCTRADANDGDGGASSGRWGVSLKALERWHEGERSMRLPTNLSLSHATTLACHDCGCWGLHFNRLAQPWRMIACDAITVCTSCRWRRRRQQACTAGKSWARSTSCAWWASGSTPTWTWWWAPRTAEWASCRGCEPMLPLTRMLPNRSGSLCPCAAFVAACSTVSMLFLLSVPLFGSAAVATST